MLGVTPSISSAYMLAPYTEIALTGIWLPVSVWGIMQNHISIKIDAIDFTSASPFSLENFAKTPEPSFIISVHFRGDIL